MKIDVLCNDGSPLGVHYSDIGGMDGRVGVGGSELALLTMCEAWKNQGHEVTLYNDPKKPNASPFEQRRIDHFNSQDNRDILLVFRSPNSRAVGAKGKKVWWSCDQYTIGNFASFRKEVDTMVGISPFHVNYLKDRYGIEASYIDLPVRLQDYQDIGEKKPRSIIFTSVPDRGLTAMANIFKELIKIVPDISLTITSDYRLWGVAEPRNEKYRTQFWGVPNVEFLGAVTRNKLVEIQRSAFMHIYPCTYEELFCYSVAESQAAGVYTVSSYAGALRTTNMNHIVETQVGGDAWENEFIEVAVSRLTDDNTKKYAESTMRKAHDRFSVETISKEWDKVFA